VFGDRKHVTLKTGDHKDIFENERAKSKKPVYRERRNMPSPILTDLGLERDLTSTSIEGE
jgi:hypothetical protein